MLSDVIFDNLYRPSDGMTEYESVLALLEGIDWYAHMDCEKEQIATLRRLAYAYLDNPSFVAYQNLHRSAVAFMRGQDAGASTPGKLVVENWEIWYQPYGRIADGEFTLTRNLPEIAPSTTNGKDLFEMPSANPLVD
jgi:hypothetical protein